MAKEMESKRILKEEQMNEVAGGSPLIEPKPEPAPKDPPPIPGPPESPLIKIARII